MPFFVIRRRRRLWLVDNFAKSKYSILRWAPGGTKNIMGGPNCTHVTFYRIASSSSSPPPVSQSVKSIDGGWTDELRVSEPSGIPAWVVVRGQSLGGSKL